MSEVWDENWFGSTKTLDVHIATLRRKLGDSPPARATSRPCAASVSAASPARSRSRSKSAPPQDGPDGRRSPTCCSWRSSPSACRSASACAHGSTTRCARRRPGRPTSSRRRPRTCSARRTAPRTRRCSRAPPRTRYAVECSSSIAAGACWPTAPCPPEIGSSYARRPEIASALRGRQVQVQRPSSTLGEQILATAVPVIHNGATVGSGTGHPERRGRAARPFGASSSGWRSSARSCWRSGLAVGAVIAERIARPLGSARAGRAPRRRRRPRRPRGDRGKPRAALAGRLVQRDDRPGASGCWAPSARSWPTPRTSCARR